MHAGQTWWVPVAGKLDPVLAGGAVLIAAPEKTIRFEIKFFPGFVLVYLLPAGLRAGPWSSFVYGSGVNVDVLLSYLETWSGKGYHVQAAVELLTRRRVSLPEA